MISRIRLEKLQDWPSAGNERVTRNPELIQKCSVEPTALDGAGQKSHSGKLAVDQLQSQGKLEVITTKLVCALVSRSPEQSPEATE